VQGVYHAVALLGDLLAGLLEGAAHFDCRFAYWLLGESEYEGEDWR
jgi:hypothetical protein